MSYNPRHANVGIDIGMQVSNPGALPARPKNFNTFGKECGITLNTYNSKSLRMECMRCRH